MKPLKPFANKTLKRKGYVLIGDIVLPIHTQGMLNEIKVIKDIKKSMNLPVKNEPAGQEEKKALSLFGYDTTKQPLVVTKIDKTSKEYQDFENKLDALQLFGKIAVNIDVKYPVEGTGEVIWQHLGLKDSKDYVGIIEWIEGLEMEERDYQIISKTIDVIASSNNKEYDDWSDNVLKKYEAYLGEEIEE